MQVTGHEINGLNRLLTITADEPAEGNASHRYVVEWDNHGYIGSNAIVFQKGPVREAGHNGVTNEALLAIVRHRLQGFQSGPYAGRENALALTKIEEALHWLHHRTAEREARGVEGTSAK